MPELKFTSQGRRSPAVALLFIGLLLTLLVEFVLLYFRGGYSQLGPFVLLMSALFFMGFVLRSLRRWAFFGDRTTLHASLSFEGLFQGATLLNPQLPFPSVEAALLKREIGGGDSVVMPWFHVRTLSAFLIPGTLLAVNLYLYSLQTEAIVVGSLVGALFAVALVWTDWSQERTGRLLSALLFGLVAVLVEATLFVQSAEMAGCGAWRPHILLCYTVTLIAYEISPIPGGLGVVELIYGILWFFLGDAAPGIVFPLAYRLARGIPALVISLFYFSRYKLSLMDLYSPLLPAAMEQGWQSKERVEAEAGDLYLSVVIPAYNERERLPIYLPEVLEYCERLSRPAEVLVVDDGSQDGTGDYVRELAQQHPILNLLPLGKNGGKGQAVRAGMLKARGRYILFADADGSTPIEELQSLLDAAEQGADVVIASRSTGDETSRSWLRGILGAVFYRITNLLAVPGISDTQCGFKLFRRRAARCLFSKSLENGWAFDVEILFLAQKFGMAILEVPVRWEAVDGSKISPARDGAKMFWALLRIRRQWAGLVDVIYDVETQRI